MIALVKMIIDDSIYIIDYYFFNGRYYESHLYIRYINGYSFPLFYRFYDNLFASVNLGMTFISSILNYFHSNCQVTIVDDPKKRMGMEKGSEGFLSKYNHKV